ncbi:hypothetical protein [Sphingomonas daechungensis]|uniref:hypothetical protein n=1 Tax=Sphingomonas daechungensis TaxID=1176646 RepID=UPI0037851B46
MASTWAKDRAQRFYAGVALFGLAAIVAGFSTTYFIPMARRTFAAPAVVHLHGVGAFTWVCLLLTQAFLVRGNRTKLHMRIGQLGLPLAVVIWSSGILTAAWAARRDLPSLGPIAETAFMGTVSGLSLFLAFVIAGYVSRRSPAAHKRWMALATIVLLWPAIFRWRHILPSMSRPDIVLGMLVANIPILVAMLRDRLRFGAVHPVWMLGGTFWFVEQGMEVALFDTHWSAPTGRALLAILP